MERGELERARGRAHDVGARLFHPGPWHGWLGHRTLCRRAPALDRVVHAAHVGVVLEFQSKLCQWSWLGLRKKKVGGHIGLRDRGSWPRNADGGTYPTSLTP